MKTKKYSSHWNKLVKDSTIIFSIMIVIFIICLVGILFALNMETTNDEKTIESGLIIALYVFIMLIFIIHQGYYLIYNGNLFWSIKISESSIYTCYKHYYVPFFKNFNVIYIVRYKDMDKTKVYIKDIKTIDIVFEPVDFKRRELLGNYKHQLLFSFNNRRAKRTHVMPAISKEDFFSLFLDWPRPYLEIIDIYGKSYLFSIFDFKISQIKDIVENIKLCMEKNNNLNYMNIDVDKIVAECTNIEEFYEKNGVIK